MIRKTKVFFNSAKNEVDEFYCMRMVAIKDQFNDDVDSHRLQCHQEALAAVLAH